MALYLCTLSQGNIILNLLLFIEATFIYVLQISILGLTYKSKGIGQKSNKLLRALMLTSFMLIKYAAAHMLPFLRLAGANIGGDGTIRRAYKTLEPKVVRRNAKFRLRGSTGDPKTAHQHYGLVSHLGNGGQLGIWTKPIRHSLKILTWPSA